jgi:hypothetical protein
MKSEKKLKTALALSATLLSGIANAAAIEISSYDITDTRLSGTGGWSHNYDGSIINVGGALNDYTDGSGTLNDGSVGTSTSNTHLFYVSDASTITLNFAESASFNSLSLFSFGPTSNGIPGNITGLDITINGITDSFLTTGFGPANPNANNGRDHSHEFLSLSGSLLEGLISDTITLSGFTTEEPYSAFFSISEIEADGDAASVPVPGSVGLIGLGLLGLGLARRKMKV